MKKQKITDVNAAIHGEVLTDEDIRNECIMHLMSCFDGLSATPEPYLSAQISVKRTDKSLLIYWQHNNGRSFIDIDVHHSAYLLPQEEFFNRHLRSAVHHLFDVIMRSNDPDYAQKWLAHNPGKTMPCMI